MSRQRIADAAGMTVRILDGRERWSRLDRRIFSGLADGKISASVATSIARMASHDQRYFGDLFEGKGRILTADVQEYLRDRKAPPVVRLQPADSPPPLTVNLSPVETIDPRPPRHDTSGSVNPPAGSVPAQETVMSSDGSCSAIRSALPKSRQDIPFPAGEMRPPGEASVDTDGKYRSAMIVPSPPVEARSGEPTGPVSAILSTEVQHAIEQVAHLGFVQGYSLTDLTAALSVAYRHVVFVEKTYKEQPSG